MKKPEDDDDDDDDNEMSSIVYDEPCGVVDVDRDDADVESRSGILVPMVFSVSLFIQLSEKSSRSSTQLKRARL